MTIINTDTGEITESLSREDARRLTDRIKLVAASVADSLDKMADLIDEARAGSAWLALGYRSWTAYVADEFGGVLPRLDREPRQEFVRELHSRGMSTRAIAPVVGVSPRQAAYDVAAVEGVQNCTPDQTPEPAVGGEAATDSGQASEGEVATPTPAPRPPVTGIDGKSYQSKPTPKPSADQLDDYIADQQAVQDSQYMKAVMRVIQSVQALAQYDAARTAQLADDAEALVVAHAAEAVATFHATFAASRSGLRLVQGDRQ